jgi:L-alanine-DL-glutamate epimerase-like enolase superfamily enzyme
MSRHLPPDKEASKVAEAVLRDHFGAVKIKVGPRLGQPGPVDLAQDEAKIRAVQQAVGRTVPLMIDGNGSYSVSEAKMLARRIDDVGIRFFEEPCPYDDIETYVQLASDPTFPPIQVGEQNWNLYTFRDFVSRRACHYYAADPVKCGGLGSAKRAAVLCRAFGVGYTPHNTTKSIGLAAAMHLALSTPECDGWYEYSIESGSDMDLINAKIGHWDGHLQDGKIWIEGKPGLGVDVDEGWLSHHLTVCR